MATVFACGLCTMAHAQAPDPDTWRESEQAPPTAFDPNNTIPFDITVYSALKFGVVPSTVSVGPDGVVRYVLVARNQTALTVLYEGLRCATRETKTYARWSPTEGRTPGAWQTLDDAPWRSVTEGNASRPALVLAKQAFCDGSTPNGDAGRMLRDLRYGKPLSN